MSYDDMIDTKEINTHLQSSFMNPKKMNHHLSDSSIWTLYAIWWNKKKKENSTSPVAPLDWDKEIEKYLDRHSAEEMTLDPLDYWIQKKDLYVVLFLVASSILCNPASTAPVERVFSESRGQREIAYLMTT